MEDLDELFSDGDFLADLMPKKDEILLRPIINSTSNSNLLPSKKHKSSKTSSQEKASDSSTKLETEVKSIKLEDLTSHSLPSLLNAPSPDLIVEKKNSVIVEQENTEKNGTSKSSDSDSDDCHADSEQNEDSTELSDKNSENIANTETSPQSQTSAPLFGDMAPTLEEINKQLAENGLPEVDFENDEIRENSTNPSSAEKNTHFARHLLLRQSDFQNQIENLARKNRTLQAQLANERSSTAKLNANVRELEAELKKEKDKFEKYEKMSTRKLKLEISERSRLARDVDRLETELKLLQFSRNTGAYTLCEKLLENMKMIHNNSSTSKENNFINPESDPTTVTNKTTLPSRYNNFTSDFADAEITAESAVEEKNKLIAQLKETFKQLKKAEDEGHGLALKLREADWRLSQLNDVQKILASNLDLQRTFVANFGGDSLCALLDMNLGGEYFAKNIYVNEDNCYKNDDFDNGATIKKRIDDINSALNEPGNTSPSVAPSSSSTNIQKPFNIVPLNKSISTFSNSSVTSSNIRRVSVKRTEVVRRSCGGASSVSSSTEFANNTDFSNNKDAEKSIVWAGNSIRISENGTVAGNDKHSDIAENVSTTEETEHENIGKDKYINLSETDRQLVEAEEKKRDFQELSQALHDLQLLVGNNNDND